MQQVASPLCSLHILQYKPGGQGCKGRRRRVWEPEGVVTISWELTLSEWAVQRAASFHKAAFSNAEEC